MATWKKVIVSGSQAHLQGITASNIPSASNANFLLYNSASGQFTYLSTSSIGNVQGTGTANQVTFWTSSNTIASNYQFTFNPTSGPGGAGKVFVSGEVEAGYLRVNTLLKSEFDTELSGSVKLGALSNNTVTVNAGTVTLANPLSATALSSTMLVITSSNRVATQTLGAGVATFLNTPSSANLIAAVTDETGTGNLVFSSSPTFTGTVGAAAITTTGNVVVGGDLTVNGETTIINTSTLSIEDKFIVLGRSSGSQTPASEGGIIIEGAAGSGSAFVFNSGSGGANGLANRWGVALGVGTASINVTPTDFMVTVSSSGVSPTDSNAPTFGSSSFGYGNMHINTTDGEIWIYV